MKKRIISLFLVIAMVVLTLTGCAYNFSKKDMSKYTEDKDYVQLLKDALSSFDIKVTDEFINDESVRQMKLLDAILANLAAKADTTVTKTEGKPGKNDLVYYSYYITYTEEAEDGTKTTYLLSTAKMKVLAVSSMAKVQLGLQAPSKDLDEKIIRALANIVFGEGDGEYKAYKNLTGADATVANGTVVYLSYEREFETTTDEGAVGKQTDVFVSHRVVLDENNPFHAELIKKHTQGTSPIKVGSTVTGGITISPVTEQVKIPVMVEKLDENGEVYKDEDGNTVMVEKLDENGEIVYETEKVEKLDAEGNPELDAEGNPIMVDKVDEEGNVVYKTKTVVTDARKDTVGTYSSLKIDFVEGSEQYAEVVDVTYEEATELDKSYYNGSAATVEKKLDVNGKELTYHIFPAFYVEVPEYTAENIINKVFADTITESILGTLLFGKEYEDANAIEDETERTAKLDELKSRYTFVNGEKEYNFTELATELASAQKAFTDADKALTTAKDKYETALKAQKEEESKIGGYKTAVETALKSVDEKKVLYTNALDKLDAAKAEFDAANAAHTAAKEASEAAPDNEDLAAALTAAKTALDAAEADYKAAEELVKSTKESLTAAIKSYNEAFATYKASYIKVTGNYVTEEISAETPDSAEIVIVSIAMNTEEEGDVVLYTKQVKKESTVIGTLVDATNVAELTYRGNKSEAGKGGAVASQLKAFDAREDLVEAFFTALGTTEDGGNMEHGKEVFIEKYEYNSIYRSLEANYNDEIQTLVNTEIYKKLLEVIEVNDVPKRAVKNTYNNMLDTYKVYFVNNLTHEGSTNDGKNTGGQTFYNYYDGSFQRYLTDHIMYNKYGQSDMTYKEALGYLEGVAEDHVEEVVKIYRMAEILDVVVTDKEFKEYQESNEYQLLLIYGYYGLIEFSEDAARLAYQFNKIMEILAANEKVTDEDGVTTVSYEKNDYVGTYNPLTEEEWEEKYPEESETETEGSEKQ